MTRTNLMPSTATSAILAASGFGLSLLLAALEAMRHSDVWAFLQMPGMIFGISIWGLDNGEYGFELVMVLINGLFYSVLLLLALVAGRALKQP